MLWKIPDILLRNNKVLVVQRLELLEKRLIKNSDKAKQYVELGHAIKLSATESTIIKQHGILHAQPLRHQPKQTEQIQMLQQNLQG